MDPYDQASLYNVLIESRHTVRLLMTKEAFQISSCQDPQKKKDLCQPNVFNLLPSHFKLWRMIFYRA